MSLKIWRTVIAIIFLNHIIWFTLAGGYDQTLGKLNSTLISKMDAGIPKQIGEKIINAGRFTYNLLLYVGDIVAIVWGFMATNRRERYTGVYTH